VCPSDLKKKKLKKTHSSLISHDEEEEPTKTL